MDETKYDKVALLAADIGSPNVVASIDKALESNAQERSELLELRKWAVRRHGEPTAVRITEPSVSAPAPQGPRLTMAALIGLYHTDARSPYHELRHRTRVNYDGLIKRIERTLGTELVGELDEDQLQAAYDEWSGGGAHIPMAHTLMGMVRNLAAFGSRNLENPDARELKMTLHDMKFERGQVRAQRLTREQAWQIIQKANQMGLRSLALAQAIQMDFGLKQKDVIGEWIPNSAEPGEHAELVHDELDQKWVRGIHWGEVDDNWVLRHVKSVNGEKFEGSLRDAPTVWEQIQPWNPKPTEGPIIVYEKTWKPYLTHQFRRVWREVATAAGIPDDVKNMDLRD